MREKMGGGSWGGCNRLLGSNELEGGVGGGELREYPQGPLHYGQISNTGCQMFLAYKSIFENHCTCIDKDHHTIIRFDECTYNRKKICCLNKR